MPPRKRKVTYPVARTATRQQRPGTDAPPRPSLVEIEMNAGSGRSDLSVGDRVRIIGSGLYSGESAVIEKFAAGAIPAALVRTEAGRTRQVRTIDLEPLRE